MNGRLPLAILAACLTAPLGAQLPYLDAPRGTLRIELGGFFAPTSEEYADGNRRALGDPIAAASLGAASSPLVRDMEARLAAILGGATAGGSLGALSADAMLQRSGGIIGLAVGVTDRVTFGARIPIVSVRTEARLAVDPEGATLGLNPLLAGDQGNVQFLQQFTTALDALQARVDAGDYAATPAIEALAIQTLDEGAALRDALDALLVGNTASPVLPTTSSSDGNDLLARVASVRDRFGNELGVPGFAAAPVLPASAITEAGFTTLLEAPEGFDLAPFDQQPLVGLGDVELEVVTRLASSRSVERRSWFGLWGTVGVALPTGTPPDPTFLRDGGTGDGQLDVVIGGVIEAGRGRIGVRAAAEYRLQMEGQRETRVGRRDEFLLPAYRSATLDWNPGDVLLVRATPYFRLADRMALSGMATWTSRGADRWSLPAGTTVPGTGTVASMGEGTSSSALRVGLGISYAHDGTARDGEVRMPVEAGLGIERTVSSGSGLVTAPLTTRLWFRVYKRLW